MEAGPWSLSRKALDREKEKLEREERNMRQEVENDGEEEKEVDEVEEDNDGEEGDEKEIEEDEVMEDPNKDIVGGGADSVSDALMSDADERNQAAGEAERWCSSDRSAGLRPEHPTGPHVLEQADISRRPWRQQKPRTASGQVCASSETANVSLTDAGSGSGSAAGVVDLKSARSAASLQGARKRATAPKTTNPRKKGSAPVAASQPASMPAAPWKPTPAPWRKDATAKAPVISDAADLASPMQLAPDAPLTVPVETITIKSTDEAAARPKPDSPRPQRAAVPIPDVATSIPDEVASGDAMSCLLFSGAGASGVASSGMESSEAMASELVPSQPGPPEAAVATDEVVLEALATSPDTMVARAESPRAVGHPKQDGPGTLLAADAPDFVPSAGKHFSNSIPAQAPCQQGTKGLQYAADQYAIANVGDSETGQHILAIDQTVPITTMLITGIQAHHTPESFMQNLDSFGLLGTYDFFYMPYDSQTQMSGGCAFVNFIDPTFATLCDWLFQQYNYEGTAVAASIQGLDTLISQFNQPSEAVEAIHMPVVIHAPTPSQGAVNGVNVMLNSKFSPQIREQFHKTRMCVFYRKNKCFLGSSCPFAHNKQELQPAPDLAKTKLCFNFFRRKCNDTKCKFAHGYQELRATETVYKTELCRWWIAGGCKAGSSCRYAHGSEELRAPQVEVPGVPMMSPEGFMLEGEDCDAFPPMMMPYLSSMQALQLMCTAGPEGVWTGDVAAASSMTADVQAEESVAATPRRGILRRSSLLRQDAVDPEPEEDFLNLESNAVLDSASDMGLSDTSTLPVTGDCHLLRQSTAPAHASLQRLSEHSLQNGTEEIILRVKGTFMEAVQVNDAPTRSMHRSWSDGDLPQLREVLDGVESGDELL